MREEAQATAVADDPKKRGGKFLTFYLEGEEYGIEILKVQEIIGLLPITRVPNTPEFVRGVINLRGRVIPTLDLRTKLGMNAAEATEQSCIVVVQVRGGQFGMIVDRVSEVLDIDDGDIEDAPHLGSDVETEFLLGIAKSGGRVRLLLDIERVLPHAEAWNLQAVNSTSQRSPGSGAVPLQAKQPQI
jgi:purine-binding chemotaxis protein CheW